MKKTLCVEKKQEALSLITGIAYTSVSAWYGCTRKNLYMDLIVPKTLAGHQRMPAIVWVCGGAYLVMDRSVWMPQMMRFARAGYVVASVDYRTSNEVSFPQPLMDVKTAVRYLKAHADDYCIDPDRIFIMGESAGGTMASLVGTTAGKKEYDTADYPEYDSSVAGVVDFYGITSLKENNCAVSDATPYYCMEAFLGVNYSEETTREASAIDQIGPDTPPFMILHGTADAVVPLGQSDSFYKKLLEKGIKTELLLIEEAVHGDDLFYQDEVSDRIIGFLKDIKQSEKQ